MNNFNKVQDAAQKRGMPTMSSETLASQIVAAAQGDARLAYDFLDTLNRHVTRMLQERSDDRANRQIPKTPRSHGRIPRVRGRQPRHAAHAATNRCVAATRIGVFVWGKCKERGGPMTAEPDINKAIALMTSTLAELKGEQDAVDTPTDPDERQRS
jgi:hypothetical protein